MYKSKFLIPAICLILTLANIYLMIDNNIYKATTPAYSSAQGGMGVGLQWLFAYVFTAFVCGILLIWIILKEVKNKQTLSISNESIFNIAIIGITLLIPMILVI